MNKPNKPQQQPTQDNTHQRLRTAKARHRDYLHSLPNVTGTGIGRKIVAGIPTSDYAIHVYVVEKKPLDDLDPHHVVPPKLSGLPTDVIQTGTIRPLAYPTYYKKERPAQGGASLGSIEDTNTGTHAFLCIDNTDGTRLVLSNNHVISQSDHEQLNIAQVGDGVRQPSAGDGGHPTQDRIASLKRWRKFALQPATNLIDAAIAQADNPQDLSPFVHQIGLPTTIRELTIDDIDTTLVQKSGRTTGHTVGLVVAIDVECTVTYGYFPYPIPFDFEDQILIAPHAGQPFCLGGDSGSLVLDMSNKLIGLIFAGGEGYAWLNRIQNVFDDLDLRLPEYSKVRVLASDGINLFAALTAPTPTIVKINPLTMTTLATWYDYPPGANCRALACNDTYLYAALYTAPTQLIRIRTAHMITDRKYTALAPEYPCYAIILDPTHLYLGLYTIAARVVQLDLNTMTSIQAWTGEVGQNLCHALASDGQHIYAGLNTSPAQVIKLHLTDMTPAAIWTGAGSQNHCHALFFDGSFLYAALNTSPAQVVKIRIEDMTTLDTWTGASGQNHCAALTSDSLSLSVGLSTSPAQVVKIRRLDMTTISTWTAPAGSNNITDLLFDGLFTFISIPTAPAQLIRKIPPNLDQTGA